jgi:hypothetical protein
LIPVPLPAPAASCPQRSTHPLELLFASGKSVRYGPCLPQRIGWLREALIAEAGRWSSLNAKPPIILGARPAEARELGRLIRDLGLTALRRVEIKPVFRRVRLVIAGGTSASRGRQVCWHASTT